MLRRQSRLRPALSLHGSLRSRLPSALGKIPAVKRRAGVPLPRETLSYFVWQGRGHRHCARCIFARAGWALWPCPRCKNASNAAKRKKSVFSRGARSAAPNTPTLLGLCPKTPFSSRPALGLFVSYLAALGAQTNRIARGNHPAGYG